MDRWPSFSNSRTRRTVTLTRLVSLFPFLSAMPEWHPCFDSQLVEQFWRLLHSAIKTRGEGWDEIRQAIFVLTKMACYFAQGFAWVNSLKDDRALSSLFSRERSYQRNRWEVFRVKFKASNKELKPGEELRLLTCLGPSIPDVTQIVQKIHVLFSVYDLVGFFLNLYFFL